MEIVNKIRDLNLNEKRDYPIPVSDTMFRKYFAPIVNSEQQLKEFLNILVEAHYLFPLSIVEPDDTLMVSGVDGYVVAEIAALKTLREKTEDDLEIAYEQQLYRRKQAATIMRELLPQARNYNNTPLGRSLNIAVMLSQFEHVLISGFAEYTQTWRRKKLQELVPDIDVAALSADKADEPTGAPVDPLAFEATGMSDERDSADSGVPTEAENYDVEDGEFGGPPETRPVATFAPEPERPPARAVDSAELSRIQEMDRSGQWGQAVDRYGVQFLLRIHFRKYEFDKVRWLLRTGKVAREEDVRYIRDTIRTMEGRVGVDLKLNRFLKDMADIRRVAQMKLNNIHQVKKKM